MRKFRAGALAAGVVAAILMVPGVAYAHHVYLDFEATGDQVPGGAGDPDGSAVGTLDFNMEESMQLCIDGTATNLDAITAVVLIEKDGEAIVADFGTSLDTCIESDEATLDGLHDNPDAYLLVVATEEFDDGAVAGELVEQEPATTTTEAETTTSSSTAATVAATAAATTPRFTG